MRFPCPSRDSQNGKGGAPPPFCANSFQVKTFARDRALVTAQHAIEVLAKRSGIVAKGVVVYRACITLVPNFAARGNGGVVREVPPRYFPRTGGVVTPRAGLKLDRP